MFKFAPIDQPAQKRGLFYYIQILMNKISSTLEVLIILLLWLFIFSNRSILGGFTREEIITYILFGNIVGLIAGYFLHRIIADDISDKSSKLLVNKPIKYFFRVLTKGFGKNFLSFILALIFHLILLYFFIDTLIINFNTFYLLIIALMIALAFITEFLIGYLINLFIFWTIESRDIYNILVRIKKFLAGAYFPLGFLPPIFVSISWVLPFAYSFYVPMELYLRKIDIATGIRGMIVQVIWIMVLYTIIQLSWGRQLKKRTEKQT